MNTKTIVTLLATLAVLSLLYSHAQQQPKDDFLEWKHEFGYQWSAEEDTFRRLIYLRNLEIIKQHNADPSQTYKMGVNQFTGLTDQEFMMIYLTPRNNPSI